MPILSSKEIFQFADQLPRLSIAATEIVSHIDNPNTSREKIVELVKADQRIFAECIKQANSAATNSFREYRTINEIVDVLGFNHVKKVALYLSAQSMINDKELWYESVFTAIAAQYLALKSGADQVNADRVYMSALFRNYGAYILRKFFPTLYIKVVNAEDFRDKMNLERELFGITHPEISALVLSEYGLPEYVTELIALQTDVYKASTVRETCFIEIARILSTIQNLDLDRAYKKLDTESLKQIVQNSGISIFTITEESIERFERQTKDLV